MSRHYIVKSALRCAFPEGQNTAVAGPSPLFEVGFRQDGSRLRLTVWFAQVAFSGWVNAGSPVSSGAVLRWRFVIYGH